MKSEILAPVGNSESLIAALNCGADAVYLGVGDFNARQNADNFSLDALKDTVSLCHKRGVKVYLTLNTLVNDGEIKKLYETVERVTLAGVDALILQDLLFVLRCGMICICSYFCIFLHKSTGHMAPECSDAPVLARLNTSIPNSHIPKISILYILLLLKSANLGLCLCVYFEAGIHIPYGTDCVL